MKLSSKYGWEVINFSTKNTGLGVREEFKSWQLCHVSFTGNPNGIAEKVAREVMLKSLARIEIPILVSNLVHLPNAFFTFWVKEGFLKHAKVLIPQRHAETMNLTPCRLPIS
ncbi:hypothetical protein MtrunA17_Chr2g0333031 [Medicago truncatula]|uniref:Uncharacterized protein n=1 Tax=Medicago truncatula TaxID=3880 RepID=A0A396JE86_MEDTR|nr:hypothetical protein MtrunA17_Chr2g0333031 [Medicago truncatula]